MKIVLIGKTNVGKSTLFNRIIEEKKAIVSEESHTTRDRVYGKYFWRGENFDLIDVGGLSLEGAKTKEEIQQGITKQIKAALREAELIIFLLDVKTGINIEDRFISQQLKKISADNEQKKEFILAINKVDGPKDREKLTEDNFLKLGFGQPVFVSAVTGTGVGDLLDQIYYKVKKNKKNGFLTEKETPEKKIIKLAILGRTNVGKSSLVNSLLNQERVIVTSIRHTTREPIDSSFFYKDKEIVLIDTAGIRKKTKIKSEIEKLGVEKSFKTVKRADIVLLMFDITERIAHLDQQLIGLIEKERKGLVLVVNKMDLTKTRPEKYVKYFKNQFTIFAWAPIVFISAKEKINLEKLLNTALSIKNKMESWFDKTRLEIALKQTIKKYGFSQKYWDKAKIYQTKDVVPKFTIGLPRITNKEIMPRQAQINLLEKKIRKEFSLWGVPIKLSTKSRS